MARSGPDPDSGGAIHDVVALAAPNSRAARRSGASGAPSAAARLHAAVSKRFSTGLARAFAPIEPRAQTGERGEFGLARRSDRVHRSSAPKLYEQIEVGGDVGLPRHVGRLESSPTGLANATRPGRIGQESM